MTDNFKHYVALSHILFLCYDSYLIEDEAIDVILDKMDEVWDRLSPIEIEEMRQMVLDLKGGQVSFKDSLAKGHASLEDLDSFIEQWYSSTDSSIPLFRFLGFSSEEEYAKVCGGSPEMDSSVLEEDGGDFDVLY